MDGKPVHSGQRGVVADRRPAPDGSATRSARRAARRAAAAVQHGAEDAGLLHGTRQRRGRQQRGPPVHRRRGLRRTVAPPPARAAARGRGRQLQPGHLLRTAGRTDRADHRVRGWAGCRARPAGHGLRRDRRPAGRETSRRPRGRRGHRVALGGGDPRARRRDRGGGGRRTVRHHTENPRGHPGRHRGTDRDGPGDGRRRGPRRHAADGAGRAPAAWQGLPSRTGHLGGHCGRTGVPVRRVGHAT